VSAGPISSAAFNAPSYGKRQPALSASAFKSDECFSFQHAGCRKKEEVNRQARCLKPKKCSVYHS